MSEDSEIEMPIREMLRLTVAQRAKVRVGGLSGRPELNGRSGTITSFVKGKGRLAVSIEKEGAAERRASGQPVKEEDKPEQVLLKPANLTLITISADGKEEEIEDDGPPPLE